MELVDAAAGQRLIDRFARRAAHRGLARVHRQRRRLVRIVAVIDEIDPAVEARLQLPRPELVRHDGMGPPSPRDRRPVHHVRRGDLGRAGVVFGDQAENRLAGVDQAHFVGAGQGNDAGRAVFFHLDGKPVEPAFTVHDDRRGFDRQNEFQRGAFGGFRAGTHDRKLDLEPVPDQGLQALTGVLVGDRRVFRQNDRRRLGGSQRQKLARRTVRAGNRVNRAGILALRRCKSGQKEDKNQWDQTHGFHN